MNKAVNYIITDESGRQIISNSFVIIGSNEISLKGLESGLYNIIIKDSNGKTVSQSSIIKE